MCVHKESWNSLNIRDPNGTCCVTEMSQFKRLIKNSYNKSQQDAQYLKFITCFRQIYCPSSGVLILYSQQMVFVILVMLTASEARMELADGNITSMTNTNCCEFNIKTPDDGQ